MQLSIDFRITGTGWAECTLRDTSASCTVTASYLSDALRHLVLAGTAVLSNFSRVTFSFEEEPGAFRWVITSPRVNETLLQILEFESAYDEKPDAQGRLLFSTTCLPITFAAAVSAAANAVLSYLGEQGYAKKWSEHPFPAEQLRELDRLLKREVHRA